MWTGLEISQPISHYHAVWSCSLHHLRSFCHQIQHKKELEVTSKWSLKLSWSKFCEDACLEIATCIELKGLLSFSSPSNDLVSPFSFSVQHLTTHPQICYDIYTENTGQHSHLCKVPSLRDYLMQRGNISRWDSASAWYSSNVNAWWVQRGTGTIILSLFPDTAFNSISMHRRCKRETTSFAFQSPCFLQKHSPHQPVSLRNSVPGLETSKQNGLSSQLSSISSSKMHNKRLPRQRSFKKLHWAKILGQFLNNWGKKNNSSFSRTKDQYRVNHYD